LQKTKSKIKPRKAGSVKRNQVTLNAEAVSWLM
jgi:hypothetical protein